MSDPIVYQVEICNDEFQGTWISSSIHKHRADAIAAYNHRLTDPERDGLPKRCIRLVEVIAEQWPIDCNGETMAEARDTARAIKEFLSGRIPTDKS